MEENNCLGIPQTSYNNEAWHNQFVNLINQFHPNIYHFVKTLINEKLHRRFNSRYNLFNLKHISLSTKKLEKKVDMQKAIANQTYKTVLEFLINLANNFY